MIVCFLKKKSHTIVSSLTRNEMFYIAFVKDTSWAVRGPAAAAVVAAIFCIKLFDYYK